MRDEKEIRDRLALVKRDDRLALPPATTDINAPLALIQMSMESEIRALQWVLGEL